MNEHVVEEHNYKVVLAKLKTNNGIVERWIITNNNIPINEINQWIDLVSINSPLTGKRYAYMLVEYLKYLDTIKKHYIDVINKNVLHGFVNYLLYTVGNENVKSYVPLKSAKTILNNISVVTGFYGWLDENCEEITQLVHRKRTRNNNLRLRKSFLYGQFWDISHSKELRTKFRFKQKRNYRKWYSEEDKKALESNFLTLRDKAIFLISVEGGCRIDEILNVKYTQYNNSERTIYIEVSKTFDRTIVLPNYACEEIDRYILTERQDVESEVGLVDWLFVNLRDSKDKGKKLKYRNYYEILKRCAKRAGLNPQEVITHAGRSTKAQQLIEHQVMYPEDGITDVLIMDMMGWTSIDSITPYKKQFNAKISKIAADKVYERKRSK